MKQVFSTEKRQNLMLMKGVFPYERFETLDQMVKQKSLPPKPDFYSHLTDSTVSDEEYQHAQNVWNEFDCKDMADYCRVYCTSDSVLLSEIMMSFRMEIYKDYNLDPANFISLPSLGKDIMLKRSGIRLDLMSDLSMIKWIRRGIRGGYSFANLRHFDTEEMEKQFKQAYSILYIDANSLYGLSMSNKLPCGEFSWLSQNELDNFNFLSPTLYDDYGFAFEVDLDYPQNLHLDHHSFPLAVEHMKINYEDLSPYAKSCLQELEMKYPGAKKLCSSFRPRRNYICHYMNLKLYLELGLVLKKVHSGIRFKQDMFMSNFVSELAEKRRTAVTEMQSFTAKLINNSVFGKTIESGDNRLDFKYVTNDKKAMKVHSDPRFKGFKICSESLAFEFLRKKKTDLRRNWICGWAILEISKFYMASLYYKIIRPTFNNNVSIIMSDTDSFSMALRTKNAREATILLSPVMDFSNLEENDPLFDKSKKNKVGYLKNESSQSEIVRFVALKSKCYAFLTEENILHTKCKGVKKSAKKKIKFENYLDCVKNKKIFRIQQYAIRAKDHQNTLTRMQRIAFTSFDDKRYLLCSIHSAPYESWLIDHQEKTGQCFFCCHPELLV